MKKSLVGYGHPPVEHQFKKGQSGNPAGRKKGSKNIATMVEEALAEKVTVNINGKRKTVSKLEAAFIQQSNKAAAGDPKAVALMISIMTGAQQRAEAQAGSDATTPEARKALDMQLLQSLRQRLQEPDDEA